MNTSNGSCFSTIVLHQKLHGLAPVTDPAPITGPAPVTGPAPITGLTRAKDRNWTKIY